MDIPLYYYYIWILCVCVFREKNASSISKRTELTFPPSSITLSHFFLFCVLFLLPYTSLYQLFTSALFISLFLLLKLCHYRIIITLHMQLVTYIFTDYTH